MPQFAPPLRALAAMARTSICDPGKRLASHEKINPEPYQEPGKTVLLRKDRKIATGSITVGALAAAIRVLRPSKRALNDSRLINVPVRERSLNLGQARDRGYCADYPPRYRPSDFQ